MQYINITTNTRITATVCQATFIFMKYEKEIDQFLRDIIYEDWMNEEDYNEVITETFKQLGTNKEKLSSDIEIGIKNGYSIETQFALVKLVLNVA